MRRCNGRLAEQEGGGLMNTWTNGKPFSVTDEHLKGHWGSGFECRLCGEKFKFGETIRWVYCNSTPGLGTGNFFVCQKCDGDDVKERAKKQLEEAVKLAKRWGIYGPDWERAMQITEASQRD